MRFDLRFVLLYLIPYVALAAWLLAAMSDPTTLTLRRWLAAGLIIVAALICGRLARMK